ncbi:MAG: hypothetical protein ACLFSA_11585 [Spirochaetaceae bacterium]
MSALAFYYTASFLGNPEGEKAYLENEELEARWEVGESYVLPMCAYSDHILEGIRYMGKEIPKSLRIEWLDPWNRRWYPLNEIPPDMVLVRIEEEEGKRRISFGPPEGAEFHPGMVRYIWFRVSPEEPGRFTLWFQGFKAERFDGRLEENNTVTAPLVLELRVDKENR